MVAEVVRSAGRVLVGMCVIAAVVGAVSPAVGSATITVTVFDDELNDDGDCSLREAVAATNGDTTVSGCVDATLAETDTILLPPGTYTLSLGPSGEDLNMGGDLDITDSGETTVLRSSSGSAQDTVIRGAAAGGTAGTAIDRILHIPNSVTAVVRDVSLINGRESGGGGGGAVRTLGTLTLEEVSVRDSFTTSLGGGISVEAGNFTLLRSEVSGNFAVHGGGLSIFATTVSLQSSTISGNQATGNGGGIFDQVTPTFTGLTIVGNAGNTSNAGTGETGGGLAGAGGATIEGSILADNTVRTDPPIPNDCGGSASSAGYNVLETAAGGCAAQFNQPGDIVGTDPGLQPLALNGPGTTRTHAITATSVAFDRWATSACTGGSDPVQSQDQRGVARPQFAACDSGAFELAPAPPSPPPPAADPTSKTVTLRANKAKVPKGKRVTLTAAVSPCAGHEGDNVDLLRGTRTIASVASTSACTAVFKVRMRRKASFQAISPVQDADHLAGTSNTVTVKVKRRPRA